MSGKAILFLVLGVSAIAIIAFSNLSDNSGQASDNMIRYYNRQSAQNIAQTGIQMALRDLADSTTWRTGYSNLSLFNGTLNTTLVDTTFDTVAVVMISSTGTSGTDVNLLASNTAIAYTIISSGGTGYIPGAVLAAVTTNNDVETNGNITIDGRDHDLNGNVLFGAGTYAVWTTNAYKRKGNSKLGSTKSGTDYSPAKVENNNTRLEGQTYAGGYPNNPDAVMGGAAMGYPPGTLKSLAQSGVSGSQYVTDPSSLSFPLSGITYVELPAGGTWNPSNIQGEGILIVHNSATDATIKNLNSGTFKGILIADDIIHVHANIIGAVVGLSPSPSSGNVIGNGKGSIKYSQQAITNASIAGSSGSSGGSSSSNVLAWWD